MSETEKEVREQTLKSNATHPDHAFKDMEALMSINLEEAHYFYTMNAFVELIVVYGYDKVIGDLRTAMSQKKW